jgi:hypothetical protein
MCCTCNAACAQAHACSLEQTTSEHTACAAAYAREHASSLSESKVDTRVSRYMCVSVSCSPSRSRALAGKLCVPSGSKAGTLKLVCNCMCMSTCPLPSGSQANTQCVQLYAHKHRPALGAEAKRKHLYAAAYAQAHALRWVTGYRAIARSRRRPAVPPVGRCAAWVQLPRSATRSARLSTRADGPEISSSAAASEEARV